MSRVFLLGRCSLGRFFGGMALVAGSQNVAVEVFNV